MWHLITGAARGVAQAAAIRLALWAGAWLCRRTITMAKQLLDPEYLTVSEAGERLGLRAIEVTRTYERGFMPPAKRLGRIRMVPAGDLEALREAAKKAGYLE